MFVSNDTLQNCKGHCKIKKTPRLTFRTTKKGDHICGCCLDTSTMSSAPGSNVYEFESKGKSLFPFYNSRFPDILGRVTLSKLQL